MKIIWTEEAEKHVNEWMMGREGFIKLKYDTEGCGCVVSGVSALWLVKELDQNDVLAETNGPSIYYDLQTEVFFDSVMTIDKKTNGSLTLKSPQQILNPSLKLKAIS